MTDRLMHILRLTYILIKVRRSYRRCSTKRSGQCSGTIGAKPFPGRSGLVLHQLVVLGNLDSINVSMVRLPES